MFPNNHVIVDRLVRDHQEEIRHEVQGRDRLPAFPAQGARARLGKLIGLLAAAGWLISVLF